MGAFTGIGDFFRGAFGEDEEEKRRRKERERQAALARVQQKPKPESFNDLQKPPKTQRQSFDNRPASQPKSGPVVLKPEIEQQIRRANSVKPAPKVAPLPDMDFKAFTANKKDRGWLPDQTEIKVDKQYKTNKDKFVADYDKLNKDVREVYFQQIRAQAKKGDQAAKNAYDALVETNRVPKDNLLEKGAAVFSVPGRSILRVGTGIVQGGAGAYDWLSPGHGTNRVSKASTSAAEFQDKAAEEANIGGMYRAMNVPTEVASYLIPGAAAFKIASKFPKGTKLTADIVNKIASKIDDAGEANKVRQFLANQMRRNMALDEILQEVAVNTRYVGQDSAQGKDISPASVAADTALSVAGTLLVPTKLRKNKKALDNLEEDEIAATGATGAAKVLDEVAQKQADEATKAAKEAEDKMYEQGVQNTADEDLEAIATNEEAIPKARDDAQAELDKRKQADTGEEDPLDRPAYLYKQDRERIVRNELENHQRYINEHPELTAQQIDELGLKTKERIAELLKQLEESRYGSEKAIGDQGEQVAEQVQGQQATSEQVKADQAAQENPDLTGTEAPNPAAGDPEMAANNAYNIDKAYEDIDSTSGRIGEATQETTNPVLKLINAARRNTTDKYRSGVDFLRDKANEGIYKATTGSGNNISASVATPIKVLFDKFGIKDLDRMDVNSYASMKGANAARVKSQAKEIEEMMAQAGDPQETSKRLYQVFEEPDMLARMYGEGTPKITPEDLTPEEKAIFDRLVELNKVRNEVWFRILQERRAAGLIDDAKLAEGFNSYKLQQDGLHSPRIYDLDDMADMGIGIKGNTNKGAYMGRKDVAELPQEVINRINANPAQSMLFRLQTGLDELGRIQAIKQIKEGGYIRPDQPNKNWVKLEGQQYGAANGMYADSRIVSELENRHIFTSDAGQAVSNALDVYRNSIFGTLDRAVKRAKTSYSPGTFIGNLVSNPLFFNRGSGVNAVSQSFNMARNVPTLVSHMRGTKLDPDILEMQRLGIKMGNTSDELVGGKQNYKVLNDKGALTKVKDIALMPNEIYAGADDLAKVSIYKTLRSRGMSPQDAALRVTQFTQDYANAGRVVQMLADSPVLGAPFARFVPELLRLTKNNIAYNPVGTFAGLYAIAAIQKELNDKSGETPEERATRENAPGKVKVPFTSWINRMVGLEGDISLDFPIGNSAVNAARALGFNFPIEPGADATESLIRNLAPFTIPFRTGPNGTTDFEGQMIVSSMALRPLAEQLFNEDFMGRKIDDPTNKIRWEKSGGDEMKYSDNMSPEAKRNNRLYHLFMNWSPLASETDAVATEAGVRDAVTQPGLNDTKKDYYGKDRTPMQAFLRSLGIKVENNDAEARQRRMDTNEYYEQDKPKTDAWLNENPDLADAYWKIRSTTRDRYTDVSANDIISPEKYKLIAGDQTGRLFDYFKQQAIDESKKTGVPLDPIYTLPPDQANQVVQLKAMNTGDDMKFQQLLYKEDWFKGYKDADRKYQAAKPEYEDKPGQAKQNPRPEEWYALSEDLYSDEGVKSRYPLVKQYQDEIAKFENYDSDERRAFTKNWYDKYGDAYKEEKANYEAERLAIVNKMRGIEGVPPMSPEVWSGQFETDSDSSGGGYGFGGGSSQPYQTNTMTNLNSYLSSIGGYENKIADMPQMEQFFRKLQAQRSGGRQKPRIGAGSSGL